MQSSEFSWLQTTLMSINFLPCNVAHLFWLADQTDWNDCNAHMLIIPRRILLLSKWQYQINVCRTIIVISLLSVTKLFSSVNLNTGDEISIPVQTGGELATQSLNCQLYGDAALSQFRSPSSIDNLQLISVFCLNLWEFLKVVECKWSCC